MKRSSKRIVLSTERKNSQGFRTRTSGIDLGQYEKNPILLWMHYRPEGKSKDEILPIGNGVDIQINGDEVSFVPLFDDTDDFALKLYNKYENGTLRACSAGLEPVKWDKDGSDIWLVKSRLVEITLCDVGSNDDSLPKVELYNESGNLITLSKGFLENVIPKSNKNTDMPKIELNAEHALPLLKLAAGSNADQFLEGVKGLVKLTETQAAEIKNLKEVKEKAEKDLTELKAKSDHDELVRLTDEAEGKGKILKETREKILGNKEKGIEPMTLSNAKTFFELLPENPTAEQTLLNNSTTNKDLITLTKDKGWKELEADGLLVELKANHKDVFKQKFRDYFKKEYQD
ncbi:MAG: hypothetical protein AAGA66_08370 [Bacteroidota bacterium]